MIVLFIFGLMLEAVSVFFALQNVAIITVNFLSWQITGSLALILSLAILSGIAIALPLLLPESVSGYFRYKSLVRENKKLKEDLQKQKELAVFAKHSAATAEELEQIEHGAVDAGAP